MKNHILLFFFLRSCFFCYSQDTTQTFHFTSVDTLKFSLTNTVDTNCSNKNIVFGEPRKPHENSFYNESMWIDDWAHTEFDLKYSKEELSLFGLESKVFTSGKTIVYDASVTEVADNAQLQGVNGVTIENGNALVEIEGRMLQIPINFVGDNSIVEKDLSKKDRMQITEDLSNSLLRTGCTPSNIDILPKQNNMELFIFKSQFTNEDFVIRRLNMRTTQIFKISDNTFLVLYATNE